MAKTGMSNPLRPDHYNSHPSGIECMDIVKHHDFLTGNVIKYIWRAGLKGEPRVTELEDMRKARVYLDEKIKQLEENRANEIKPRTTAFGVR